MVSLLVKGHLHKVQSQVKGEIQVIILLLGSDNLQTQDSLVELVM